MIIFALQVKNCSLIFQLKYIRLEIILLGIDFKKKTAWIQNQKKYLMKKLLKPDAELEQEEPTYGINLATWEFPYTNPKKTPLNPDFG